ncbi:antibiotic biosynthesis monooxygenase [bacterium]|nr:antibiotic biosynthesis monooxygenase [bacterium]
MYVAMNRFRIARGREDTFEEIWRTRDSQLDKVPGFREFHLLRGEPKQDATVIVSHSLWESREAFIAWTESDAFRQAHRNSRSPEGTVLGPPEFEGFEVVL